MAHPQCWGGSARLSQPLAAQINQQAVDKIEHENPQEATKNMLFYLRAFRKFSGIIFPAPRPDFSVSKS
jgi:hypothetical protein